MSPMTQLTERFKTSTISWDFVGFAKPTKSHDMVLVLLISMSWIKWHTSFWILVPFRFFFIILVRREFCVKMYWYENFRSHPSNFYQKYFLYMSHLNNDHFMVHLYNFLFTTRWIYRLSGLDFDKIALISCNLTTINLFPYCTLKVYHFMKFLGRLRMEILRRFENCRACSMISSVKRIDLYAFLARLHLENWMTRPNCWAIDYSFKFS